MKGKRILAVLLSLAMLVLLVSCGSQTAEIQKNEASSNGITYKRPEEEKTWGPTGAQKRINFDSLSHRKKDGSGSKVYFTDEISPDGIMKAYKALGVKPKGKVAVKLSTGESGDNYYLDPNLVADLIHSVNGTIVECNTAYGGSRAETAVHEQTIKEHGWDQVAKVDIMDRDGSLAIPVQGGTYLKQNLVGKNLKNYDFVVVLSHFKGHAMAGFGGALKNISIGIGSKEGKSLIHTGGRSHSGFGVGVPHKTFTSSMAEAAKSVYDYENHGKNMLFINVMNNLSVDCDCDSSPAKPTMKNIGILASTDPVALDQACLDLVYGAPDSKDLRQRIESREGVGILDHAQDLHFGNRYYNLIILK